MGFFLITIIYCRLFFTLSVFIVFCLHYQCLFQSFYITSAYFRLFTLSVFIESFKIISVYCCLFTLQLFIESFYITSVFKPFYIIRCYCSLLTLQELIIDFLHRKILLFHKLNSLNWINMHC